MTTAAHVAADQPAGPPRHGRSNRITPGVIGGYRCDGSRHFGHVESWGDGCATVGGTVLHDVVCMDFVHTIGSGGHGPAPEEDAALVTQRHPAAAPFSPATGTSRLTHVMSPVAGEPSARAVRDRTNNHTASLGATGAACDTTCVTSPGMARDGQGNRAARPGRWMCRCGHGFTAHSSLGLCSLCATCDRFRRAQPPATFDAAGSGQPAAS